MSVPSTSRFRVIVVGCGAIARWFHIPVLAGHPDVEIVGLVDPAVNGLQDLAAAYGVQKVAANIGQLDGWTFDGAVVATPPSTHAEICRQLSSRGFHVMVEKPMALNLKDATAMVEAASSAHRVLSVGLCRRLYPSVGLLRSMVRDQTYGRLLSFEVEEGYVFDWPSATLAIMRRELAGGGVLVDTGSHTLDQLLWIVGRQCEVLEYSDDSRGGIDADAEIRLRLHEGGESVEGRVTLSRARTLKNTLKFDFERASVEMSTTDRSHLRLSGPNLAIPASGSIEWRHVAEVTAPSQRMEDSRAPFRAQLDDWLQAVRSGAAPVLSGASALPVIALIEQCYSRRQPLPEPWAVLAVEATPPAPKTAMKPPSRVLVTGAAGFIGCRLVETLHARGITTRALVHRPGGASRLARMGIEMVQGDIRNEADVERVMDGCDAVINCAYGTEWGNAKAMRDVTVGGTERLFKGARRAGVKRFVHLSTIMVYGYQPGVITEESPLHPTKGDAYAEGKRDAESVIMGSRDQGISAVVLRLGNVYGPFSGPFTIRPIRRLADRKITLVDDGLNASNTVYVDNVVEAIALALKIPMSGAGSQVFNVCDQDGFTWREFLQSYADVVGEKPRSLSGRELDQMEAEAQAEIRRSKSLYRGLRGFVTSQETKALAGRAFRVEPFGPSLRRLIESTPSVRDWLARRFSGAPPVYPEREVGAFSEADLFRFYQWPGQISAASAREELGVFTVVPRATALERSIEWARHSRLI